MRLGCAVLMGEYYLCFLGEQIAHHLFGDLDGLLAAGDAQRLLRGKGELAILSPLNTAKLWYKYKKRQVNASRATRDKHGKDLHLHHLNFGIAALLKRSNRLSVFTWGCWPRVQWERERGTGREADMKRDRQRQRQRDECGDVTLHFLNGTQTSNEDHLQIQREKRNIVTNDKAHASSRNHDLDCFQGGHNGL